MAGDTKQIESGLFFTSIISCADAFWIGRVANFNASKASLAACRSWTGPVRGTWSGLQLFWLAMMIARPLAEGFEDTRLCRT